MTIPTAAKGAYYGTIKAREADRIMLESLGVDVGAYDDRAGHFVARVDAAAHERLRDYESDFQPEVFGRKDDRDGLQLRAGMTLDDLLAERAYVDFKAATATSKPDALTWKVARNAVLAMATAIADTAGVRASMSLSGKKIASLMRLHRKSVQGLAEAMNIPRDRVMEVRQQGVQGEAFVLDWIEAIHKMDSQDYDANLAQARESAQYLESVIRRAWENPDGPWSENPPTRDRRITGEIERRHQQHETAYCDAKRNDLLALGPDITARLAELRKRNVAVLSTDVTRRWAHLDAREFAQLRNPDARKYAATLIVENMNAVPTFRAAFQEAHPEMAATILELNDQADQRVADRDVVKSERAETAHTQYLISEYLHYAPAVPGTDMGEQQGGDTYWMDGRGWSYSTRDATRYPVAQAHVELSRLHALGRKDAKLVEAPAPWLRERRRPEIDLGM